MSPVKIETEIRCIEGVRDAAVVGIPDLKAGEIPLAFVVRSEGSTITEEEVGGGEREGGDGWYSLLKIWPII